MVEVINNLLDLETEKATGTRHQAEIDRKNRRMMYPFVLIKALISRLLHMLVQFIHDILSSSK